MSIIPTRTADDLREALARLASPAIQETSELQSAAMDVLVDAAGIVDFAQLLAASPVVIPRARIAPLERSVRAYIEAANAIADRGATA